MVTSYVKKENLRAGGIDQTLDSIPSTEKENMNSVTHP
jgi:hypothetical protein